MPYPARSSRQQPPAHRGGCWATGRPDEGPEARVLRTRVAFLEGKLKRLGYQQCEESCRCCLVAGCGSGGSPCLWCLWFTATKFARILRCSARPPQRGGTRRSRRRNADSRGRFVRWQTTTIAQFGFLTNTVLVLTTASIGFAFNHAFAPASTLGYELKCVLTAGIVSLGLSGLFALLCSWNRLLDFRLTTTDHQGIRAA